MGGGGDCCSRYLGRSFALVARQAASARRCWWLRGKPLELVGKRALCCPTTGLGRHCPAMLPTGRAGWNRHQPASQVSVPAAIRGGDAVAEEGPSGVSDALSARSKPC